MRICLSKFRIVEIIWIDVESSVAPTAGDIWTGTGDIMLRPTYDAVENV
jgi:hypothetical protein